VDLRAVRAGLERPDAVTNSAAKARDEIGRAIASKIRELEGSGELKEVAEDVLPKIEQFLESAEEKRLRRMRTGVITSSAGLGAMLMFLIVAMVTGKEGIMVAFGAATVAFIIGLGIIINGKLLTVQRGQVSPRQPETLPQSSPDQLPEIASAKPVELHPALLPPPSVVEHTTHKLSTEPINVGRQTPIKDKN
jgi:hypothetical protein